MIIKLDNSHSVRLPHWTNKNQEVIARAALELIAEKGFHGAPMAMITKRANVGAGTIYRYFENKDALIIGLYKKLEDRLYMNICESACSFDPFRHRRELRFFVYMH